MRSRSRLLFFYAALFLLFLYGPILLAPLFSFNDSTFATFPLKGLTFRHYAEMARNTGLLQALRNSLIVATATAVIATAVSLPAAIALTRYKLPGAGAILTAMSAPLIIPSIVFGVALLIIILRFLDLELSLWTIAASHVFICIPFAMTVLMSRLEGFDKSLEEASRDLGEDAWMTFLRVTLPLAKSGIVSSLLLCFVTSFDEFVLAFFLSGTEPTLPVYLFGQLRFPNKLPGMLALGSTILFFSGLIVILAEILRRRGVQSNSPGDI
ncbi:ABC transporter permease [Taklimakanibacter deserti]|uniref:ABC transporter permease n=1 Tax=Taklimakanibacter deserti TaxID=2267839 RepID=UPI000E6562D4